MTRLLVKYGDVPGVFSDGEHLYTVNAAPGQTVYGERLVSMNGVEYRAWDPGRSKLAAAILLGAKGMGIDPSTKVLYLGAASGTTASHVSDIVLGGIVHCVEVSQRSFRDLVSVCESRRNMIPHLADANRPEDYSHEIEGIELVYQDIAQRNQVDIFVRNMAAFDAGHGILMLKSRSINVNRKPKEVFAEVRNELAAKTLKVRSVVDLERYSKDHAAFIVEA
ncbi:MAG: fibrillarin-like rRNA/tRNA 2'-O-methyltransferase [Thermoplasmata archaeon]|jgi:fibrillarin-like pre-rRNA processing protein|nr:fibrillarin-like rRNA/tRNA 2'-O-methyltransferase [Thermoplasmata archaeon]